MCVLLCQPATFYRGSWRYLPRNFPRYQDLQACWAEGKLYAQAPRKEDGRKMAPDVVLEQAGKLKNREQHGDNVPLLTRERILNRRLGTVKETLPKPRLDNISAWGTSKRPWGIPTAKCSFGRVWEKVTDLREAHRRLRQHLPTAKVLTNSLTKAPTTRKGQL